MKEIHRRVKNNIQPGKIYPSDRILFFLTVLLESFVCP